MVNMWLNTVKELTKVEVLIFKEDETLIRNISVSGVKDILGSEKYTQRVIMPKRGYRIVVWFNEKAQGKERVIKLYDGEQITVKGTFIVVHEEYGAYKNISLDDMGVVMLVVEDKRG